MVYCFIFSAYIRFFLNVLIEMNVNINNEFIYFLCLSKCKLHWVARKVYMNRRGSFTLHATQCSLHFDKPQKNEIHSLIKFLPRIMIIYGNAQRCKQQAES